MNVLNDQAVILILTMLAVLYHLCMRNDAELLQKVKEPVTQKVQAVRSWISHKFAVCRCHSLLLAPSIIGCMCVSSPCIRKNVTRFLFVITYLDFIQFANS